MTREQLKELRRLKRKKMSINQAAHHLHIAYDTAKKYWDYDLKTYDKKLKEFHKKIRRTKAEVYRDDILEIIQDDLDILPSQIFNYLYEKYKVEPVVGQKTLMNYYYSLQQEN